MSLENLETLVQRAQKGKVDAFEEIVRGLYPIILNYTFRILRNRADAEETTQDVFVKAGESIVDLKKTRAFKSWLYSIAYSKAQDCIRKQGRRQNRESAYYEIHAEQSLKHDDGSKLTEAIAKLPDDMRQTVILVYWENLKHAEVAAILNCAESTVSWKIHQAKKQLKLIMEVNT